MFTCEPSWISKLAARRARHYAAAWLVLSGVFFTCIPCSAHNTYPQQLADLLSMPCVPQCTLCHRDNLGGFGTIVEPFGISMQKGGLTFFPTTLEPAAKQLEAQMVDSDGDGVDDIAELSAGQDPNGNLDLCAIQAPRYGCGAHIATAPIADDTGALGALLVAAFLGASTRRRKRPRPRLDTTGNKCGEHRRP